MSESSTEQTPPGPQRKWLRRSLLALAALLVLVSAIVLSVPALVSSDWARGKAVQAMASSTGKPVSLRLLSFGWSSGLSVEGLRIGEGSVEDDGFLCSLDRLHVTFGFLSALRKDLRLDVLLSGLRLRLQVEPGAAKTAPPPAAPGKPLPALLRDTLMSLRQGLKPGPQSVDAHVSVDLSDIAVRLDVIPADSAQKALRVDLRDVAVRLSVPGLAKSPARLDAGLKIMLNGKELAPLTAKASIDGIVDKAGQMVPAQARLEATAELPGIHLTALGSVARGFKTDLRLDLRDLTALLRPLAGQAVPEASGALALGLTAAQPDADHLQLGLVLFADALRAAGGPLGDKAVCPVRLNLLQEAGFDLASGTLRLPGTLNIADKSAMSWQAEVTGLNQGQPSVALNIHPLHLRLDDLAGYARAWLPAGLTLGPSSLDAEGIGLMAELPEKPDAKPRLEASLKGLTVEARNVARASGPVRLGLGRGLLRLEQVQAVLPATGTGRLEASATLELDALRMQGKTPLTVKRIGLTRLAATLDSLAQDPAALFGVTGAADLKLDAEVLGVDAPGLAQVPALSQSLALRAELPPAKNATARLDSLALDMPQARLLRPGRRPVTAPVSLRLSAPDIRLDGPAPLALGVRDAKLDLDAGQALRCTALSSLSGKELRSTGGLNLDVGKLLALAAPLLPPGAKGSGSAVLDWKLAATLPQGTPPSAKPLKLSQTLASLGFLQNVETELKLSDIALDWPLAASAGAPAETLRLRGLSTPRPLRASTRRGLGESSLSGSLAFGPLAELPGVGPLQRPLSGLVTLTASQQALRSVQFAEVLHLDGLGLDQNLRLTLDRLDQVLDRDQDRLAAILEQVDGTVGADLKIDLANGLKGLPGKSSQRVSGRGGLDAGFDARLSAGRSLVLAARLLSPGLDLELGPGLAITGLTSSIRLNKRYALSPGLRCAAPAEDARPPLSEQVFNLFPAITGGRDDGANSGADAYALALPQDFRSGGGLGFNQLRLKSGALPLSVRDVHLSLDAGGALPALRSIRAGLLGGNLLGSALVKGARGAYRLEADLAFTGIDPSRLFPAKAAKDLGDQAETSGRVSLSLPLTPDAEALLQRMALRADITKVGPRTLERMLYALDPDEQNETIVQQRRLMGIGYPRFVNLGLDYGNLSLSGEVEVKGFRLALPRIDRLPVGNLPIRTQLSKALAPVPGLVKALDAVAAGSICRDPADPQGRLKVSGTTAQEGVAP